MDSNKEGRGKLWIATGIFITVLLIAALAVNWFLAPLAARKLAHAVNAGSAQRYQLKFDRLSLNIYMGTAALENVQLIPDPRKTQAAGFVAAGSAAKIEFSGVRVLTLLFHKELQVGRIQIVSARLAFTRRRKPSQPEQGQTLDQQLREFARLIKVDVIQLTQVDLAYADSTRKAANLHLQRLDLAAHDLLISPESVTDTTRTLFCKEITAALNGFSGYTHDRAYHYTLAQARFSTRTRQLHLEGIALSPLAPPLFFQKMRTDRFEFALDSLTVREFNYRSLLAEDILRAKHINGYHGRLDIFGNPHGKPKPGDRIVGFPHVVLQRMATRIAADTLDLAAIDISYRELNRSSGKIGRVSFLGTRARFIHITNLPDRIKADPWCQVRVNTLFMGQGRLSVTVRFSLAAPLYRYTLKGNLGPMPATAVNPVAMPLGLTQIRSGQIEAMDFDIRGDRYRNLGTLHATYHDVTVEALQANYHQQVLKTLLVNAFVLKHNNPDEPGKPPRFAKIVFLRPKSYPFFKTVWNTLFNGFKSCAGVGPAVQPEPHESLTKKIAKTVRKLFKRAKKKKQQAEKKP